MSLVELQEAVLALETKKAELLEKEERVEDDLRSSRLTAQIELYEIRWLLAQIKEQYDALLQPLAEATIASYGLNDATSSSSG